MRRIWTPSRRRLMACAGGLAIGLAGLAGRPAPQAMTEVTFVVVNNLFSTPAFVAVENGYWTKQGLNVKIKLTSSGRQVTQSLQAGEAQFGHAALSTTTAAGARQRQHAQGRDALLQRRRLRRQGRRPRHHRPQGPRHRRRQPEVDGRQEDRLPQGQHQRRLPARNGSSARSSTSPNRSSSTCPSRTCRSRWRRARSTPSRRGSPIARRRCASSAPMRSSSAAARKAWWPTSSAWSRTRIGSARTTTCREVLGRHRPGGAVRPPEPEGRGRDRYPLPRRPQRRRRHRRPEVAHVGPAHLRMHGRWPGQDRQRHGQGRPHQDGKPFTAEDFYDDTVLKRVLEKHPQFFADLPPLPKTLAECKGKLS